MATLLRLAYPDAISRPIADFGAIEAAVNGKRRLKLMDAENAKQALSYAPFPTEWLESRLKDYDF